MIKGTSGIKRWHSLDMSRIECKIGGDLGDYDCNAALARYEELLGPLVYKKVRKIFRSTTFSAKASVLCTLAAWADAGLFRAELIPAGQAWIPTAPALLRAATT